MKTLKSLYNRTMSVVTPFVQALVVVSLLLSGAILLNWIEVSNPTVLGYFVLAQGITFMTYNFKRGN